MGWMMWLVVFCFADLNLKSFVRLCNFHTKMVLPEDVRDYIQFLSDS